MLKKSLFFTLLFCSTFAYSGVASIADYLVSLLRATESANIHSFIDIATQRFIKEASGILSTEEKQFIKAVLYEPKNNKVVLIDAGDFFHHHVDPKTYLMVGKKINNSERAQLEKLIRQSDGSQDYKLLAHDLIEKTTTELDEGVLDLVEKLSTTYPFKISNDIIKPSLKRDAYDMLITNREEILFMRVYELDLRHLDLAIADRLIQALRSL